MRDELKYTGETKEKATMGILNMNRGDEPSNEDIYTALLLLNMKDPDTYGGVFDIIQKDPTSENNKVLLNSFYELVKHSTNFTKDLQSLIRNNTDGKNIINHEIKEMDETIKFVNIVQKTMPDGESAWVDDDECGLDAGHYVPSFEEYKQMKTILEKGMGSLTEYEVDTKRSVPTDWPSGPPKKRAKGQLKRKKTKRKKKYRRTRKIPCRTIRECNNEIKSIQKRIKQLSKKPKTKKSKRKKRKTKKSKRKKRKTKKSKTKKSKTKKSKTKKSKTKKSKTKKSKNKK